MSAIDPTVTEAAADPAPDPALSEALARRVAQKDAILIAALANAAFDGWQSRTLERSTEEAGLDKAQAALLFPRGTADLLAWIDDWADRQMLAKLPVETLAGLPVRRRVELLIEARLSALLPHQEAVRRALLTRGLPQNALGSLRSLWHTADRIWEAVGIDAENRRSFSHYSRRATLAAVLVSVTLYWLEDRSPRQTDTQAFIRRRIDDVLRLGKGTSSARRILGRLPTLRPGLSAIVERTSFRPGQGRRPG